jgi:hypothetical protein
MVVGVVGEMEAWEVWAMVGYHQCPFKDECGT